jgi:hypothetical protein
MAFAVNDSIRGGSQITWDPITGAVAEAAIELGFAERFPGGVQVIGGTAGVLAMQASLDGVNWAPLINRQGAAITLTNLNTLQEFNTPARFIRPIGDAASVGAIVRVVIHA